MTLWTRADVDPNEISARQHYNASYHDYVAAYERRYVRDCAMWDSLDGLDVFEKHCAFANRDLWFPEEAL